MNLKQLKLFNDIAREQSFVKAAQLNHISQPAVSVHIGKLEGELGKQLFNRSHHSVQLTPDGLVLLPDVKEILRLCENLKIKSSFDQGAVQGDIRLAAVYSIGMYEMGDFLSAFMKNFPGVSIHLEYRSAEDIYRLLLQGKVDLGVVAFPEKRTKIKIISYGSDNLELIVHADHRLATKSSVSIEELEGEAFIAFDESFPTREAIDRQLEENGVSVDIRMTNDNIYTLKKAVEAKVGISIVPSKTVDEEVQRGSIVRVKIRNIDTVRPLAMLRSKKNKPNALLKLFVQQFLNYYVPQTGGDD